MSQSHITHIQCEGKKAPLPFYNCQPCTLYTILLHDVLIVMIVSSLAINDAMNKIENVQEIAHEFLFLLGLKLELQSTAQLWASQNVILKCVRND